MLLPVLIAMAAQPVSVSSMSMEMIAEQCATGRALELNPCTAYILGVADALQLTRATCRPSSGSATIQAVTISRRYIYDHPEKWNRHPSALIREALQKAFPCRR